MWVGIVAPSFDKSRFSSSVSTISLNWNWSDKKKKRCFNHLDQRETNSVFLKQTLRMTPKKNLGKKNRPGLCSWVQLNPVLSPLWTKCRAARWWGPPPSPQSPSHLAQEKYIWNKFYDLLDKQVLLFDYVCSILPILSVLKGFKWTKRFSEVIKYSRT